jgi:hypothetical protein
MRGNFNRNDPQWQKDRGVVLYRIAPIVLLILFFLVIFCDK